MKKTNLLALLTFLAVTLSSNSCSLSQSGIHVGKGTFSPPYFLEVPIEGLTTRQVDPVILIPAVREAARLMKQDAKLVAVKTQTNRSGLLDLTNMYTNDTANYTFWSPSTDDTFDLTARPYNGRTEVFLGNPGKAGAEAMIPIPQGPILPLPEAIKRAIAMSPSTGPTVQCTLKVFPAHGPQPEHCAWAISGDAVMNEVLVEAGSGRTLAQNSVYESDWEKLLAGKDGSAWYFHPTLDPAPRTFPLPTYPHCKVLGTEPDSKGKELYLVTPDSASAVNDYYLAFLQSSGWTLSPESSLRDRQKDYGYLEASKYGISVVIDIQHRTSLTEVSLTYSRN